MTKIPSIADAAALSAFEVDPGRGFLPAQDPMERLPEAFDDWERLALAVPALLASDELRPAVNELQLRDVSKLATPEQMQRAMLVLSVVGNAYVLGGCRPAPAIPASIAVPWCWVADQMGRPPIASHASLVLQNWRRLDHCKPLTLDNLACQLLFTGSRDEEWFYLTTVALEAAGAPALPALVRAQSAAKSGAEEIVDQSLATIATVVSDMERVLARMWENCAPRVFYDQIRPFLSGWPDSGVVYEAVDPAPRKLVGGSAAQSSLLPALDAGLGIYHGEPDTGGFLLMMRGYMPPAHRRFIEALQNGPSLREFVRSRGHARLRDCYNGCIRALESFRTRHLTLAMEYIHQFAPNKEKSKGTGGTSFVSFLNKVKNTTRRCTLD